MDYRLLFEEANKEVEERFELASGRIRELAFGDICQKLSEGFQEYFLRAAGFAVMILDTEKELWSEDRLSADRVLLEERNRRCCRGSIRKQLCQSGLCCSKAGRSDGALPVLFIYGDAGDDPLRI